jgi:hypothetical protein
VGIVLIAVIVASWSGGSEARGGSGRCTAQLTAAGPGRKTRHPTPGGPPAVCAVRQAGPRDLDAHRVQCTARRTERRRPAEGIEGTEVIVRSEGPAAGPPARHDETPQGDGVTNPRKVPLSEAFEVSPVTEVIPLSGWLVVTLSSVPLPHPVNGADLAGEVAAVSSPPHPASMPTAPTHGARRTTRCGQGSDPRAVCCPDRCGPRLRPGAGPCGGGVGPTGRSVRPGTAVRALGPGGRRR